MTVTLPISLILFIIIVTTLAPLLCVIATWTASANERRRLERRELEVDVRNRFADELSLIHAERAEWLWKFDKELMEKQQKIRSGQRELGRRAHDAATQAHLAVMEHSDTITMPRMED